METCESQARPRLYTRAFGCQMSAADVAEMSGALVERGYTLTSDLSEADAVLVGTCTVREHAEHRALSYIGRLRRWKRERPSGALIVAGCAAERLGPDIKRRFPHVDLVTGSKSVGEFPSLIDKVMPDHRLPRGGQVPEGRRSICASVTVMRGCDRSCSYCIVPSVRGREVYRPADEILAEVRRKAEAGAKEVTLLGQTVNSYRSSVSFADLLALVDSVAGIERIRFMSPHPLHLDGPMAHAMAECRKVAPALHLPAQSGSDRILGLMRRGYDRAAFLEKVSMVRRAVPGLTVTTDFLVGFPSETDEDFQSTLSLFEDMGAVSAYCFKYSPRASTPSAFLPDDVPRRVKEDRLARLNAFVAGRTAAYLDSLAGREVQVLTEEPGVGRAADGFKVRLVPPVPPVPPGRLVQAQVVGRTRNMLFGNLLRRNA
ncbi:MAG: tRNA (N6-isopentenyl adenosine(37)-C2)-methylthiotransferase MiaB [Elusimicrobia bacterium]|nr:tRNA (N6-isopentenyl adenosine(37)-C2)-methylthiotransferase MiaB [Elusimicrobiota bacterium]